MKKNRIWNYICNCAGLVALFVMSCPAELGALAAAAGAAVLLSALLTFLEKRGLLSPWTPSEGRDRRLFRAMAITFAVMIAQGFYLTWEPSGRVAALAARFHLSKKQLLTAASVVLGALCAQGIGFTGKAAVSLYRKLAARWKIRDKRHSAAVAAILVLEYLSLEYSAIEMLQVSLQKPAVFLINLAVVVLVNMVIGLLSPSAKIQFLISGALFSIWGIANFYVIRFHGSPLYLSELANTKTALNVIGGYRFTPGLTTIVLVVLWGVELLFALRFVSGAKALRYPKRALRSLAAAAVCLAVLFVGLFSHAAAVPEYFGFLSWNSAIRHYGFMACVVRDLQTRLRPTPIPAGYDPATLSLPVPETTGTERRPDIILILNESFCDLTYFADLETDTDCLADFYAIEGASYGYAVVPWVGGGTNDAEFELLTSNSIYLLPSMAPFTYLEDTSLNKGVVPYLESLGYTTTAMHCAGAANYARNTGYPAMGFDRAILEPEDYTFRQYGERNWLDEDNYADLLDQLQEDQPQFIFLLSYQNHGGYEQNGPEEDTVHVLTDLGGLTDDASEYMSSLQKSAEAFRMLTEALSDRERPVIVCMVGDHAPTLVRDLPMRADADIPDETIANRVVPFVIWTNDPATDPEDLGYASMVDLVPILLEKAGLPLSPYYAFLLDLHDRVPIRTSEGRYVDRDGTIGRYEQSSPCYELMNTYYCLEYNELFDPEHYREELFLPAGFQEK